MGFLIFIVGIYVVGIFFYSRWLYNKSYVYFRPLTYQKDKTSEIVDVHKMYDEFKAKEVLTFPRVFFGSLVFFILRMPFILSFTLIMTFQLM